MWPAIFFSMPGVDIRDLKIVVYGKRLTSDTLFAIKAKSLNVKCFTYLSKIPKTTYRAQHSNLVVDIKLRIK